MIKRFFNIQILSDVENIETEIKWVLWSNTEGIIWGFINAHMAILRCEYPKI